MNQDAKLDIFRELLHSVIPPHWMLFERDGVIGIIDGYNAPTAQSIADMQAGLALLEKSVVSRRAPGAAR